MESKSIQHSYEQRRGIRHLKSFVIACGLFTCWWITAIGQLVKYLSPYAVITVSAAAFLSICCILMLVRWRIQEAKDVSTLWLFILWSAFVLCGLALYPVEVSHKLLGSGSDREDALVRALQSLRHHHYPYYVRTFRGNPITPMPGAFLLAFPFYWLGRVSIQNFFWAAMFLWVCREVFRTCWVASIYFLIYPAPASGKYARRHLRWRLCGERSLRRMCDIPSIEGK